MTMAELGYGWLLIVVIGALVWYGLRTYHQRELARIETAELELLDWVKLALAKLTFLWQCPHCGALEGTREGVAAHEDPDTSACAEKVARDQAMQDRLDREASEQEQERWSASATLVPEHSVTTADDDPAAELEA